MIDSTELDLIALSIHLASNYLFSSGEAEGDNRMLEGEKDRRFGAYGDLRQDYPSDSKYFGIFSPQILPYLENVAFMLEAVCNSMGAKTLPPVPISVKIPVASEA